MRAPDYDARQTSGPYAVSGNTYSRVMRASVLALPYPRLGLYGCVQLDLAAAPDARPTSGLFGFLTAQEVQLRV